MPIIDTRDDRKVNEAEIFYFSALMDADLSRICNFSSQALQRSKNEWETANWLKATLEQNFPGKWVVVVGKTFGAFLTVDARNFVHFRIGRTYFVLFRL